MRVLDPPRFEIVRDDDGSLSAEWSNPPAATDELCSEQLREIALALLDVATWIHNDELGRRNERSPVPS